MLKPTTLQHAHRSLWLVPPNTKQRIDRLNILQDLDRFEALKAYVLWCQINSKKEIRVMCLKNMKKTPSRTLLMLQHYKSTHTHTHIYMGYFSTKREVGNWANPLYIYIYIHIHATLAWHGKARQEWYIYALLPERRWGVRQVSLHLCSSRYLHMPTVVKPPAFPTPVKRAHASSSPRNARMLGWGHQP